MKMNFIFFVFIFAEFFFVVRGMAAENSAVSASLKPTKIESNSEKKSQTDHSFEDLLIQGKYHFSDEAVTTVEEDKVLDALIGVRTDFKDRLEKSAEQF